MQPQPEAWWRRCMRCCRRQRRHPDAPPGNDRAIVQDDATSQPWPLPQSEGEVVALGCYLAAHGSLAAFLDGRPVLAGRYGTCRTATMQLDEEDATAVHALLPAYFASVEPPHFPLLHRLLYRYPACATSILEVCMVERIARGACTAEDAAFWNAAIAAGADVAAPITFYHNGFRGLRLDTVMLSLLLSSALAVPGGGTSVSGLAAC